MKFDERTTVTSATNAILGNDTGSGKKKKKKTAKKPSRKPNKSAGKEKTKNHITIIKLKVLRPERFDPDKQQYVPAWADLREIYRLIGQGALAVGNVILTETVKQIKQKKLLYPSATQLAQHAEWQRINGLRRPYGAKAGKAKVGKTKAGKTKAAQPKTKAAQPKKKADPIELPPEFFNPFIVRTAADQAMAAVCKRNPTSPGLDATIYNATCHRIASNELTDLKFREIVNTLRRPPRLGEGQPPTVKKGAWWMKMQQTIRIAEKEPKKKATKVLSKDVSLISKMPESVPTPPLADGVVQQVFYDPIFYFPMRAGDKDRFRIICKGIHDNPEHERILEQILAMGSAIELYDDDGNELLCRRNLTIRKIKPKKAGEHIEWYIDVAVSHPVVVPATQKSILVLHRGIAHAFSGMLLRADGTMMVHHYPGHEIVRAKQQMSARRRRLYQSLDAQSSPRRGKRYYQRLKMTLGDVEKRIMRNHAGRISRWIERTFIRDEQPELILVDDFGDFMTDILDADRGKYYEPYIRFPSTGFRSVIVEALGRRTGIKIEEFIANWVQTTCPVCGHESTDNIERFPKVFGQTVGRNEEGPCSINGCTSSGRGIPLLCDAHGQCTRLTRTEHDPTQFVRCTSRGYGNPPQCEKHTSRIDFVPQDGKFKCTACENAASWDLEEVALYNIILAGRVHDEENAEDESEDDTRLAAPDWAREALTQHLTTKSELQKRFKRRKN